MQRFNLVTAYLENGTELTGIIPNGEKSWGTYHAKYPYEAASKAYSNLIRFTQRYKNGWYPELTTTTPMVIVIRNNVTSVQLMYYVYRERAPQSVKTARMVFNANGKIRKYLWKNRVIPMRDDETVADAMRRHQQRSIKARQNVIALQNLVQN